MRFTATILGWSLDIELGPATVVDEAPTIGGETGTTWLGFTAAQPIPEEVPFPQRTPAWDDEEERA